MYRLRFYFIIPCLLVLLNACSNHNNNRETQKSDSTHVQPPAAQHVAAQPMVSPPDGEDPMVNLADMGDYQPYVNFPCIVGSPELHINIQIPAHARIIDSSRAFRKDTIYPGCPSHLEKYCFYKVNDPSVTSAHPYTKTITIPAAVLNSTELYQVCVVDWVNHADTLGKVIVHHSHIPDSKGHFAGTAPASSSRSVHTTSQAPARSTN